MATKIYITGNFLVAEDPITRVQFFKINIKNVHHQRSADDFFAFFQEGLFPTTEGQPQFLQLGVQKAWEFDTQELENQSQSSFVFSEILDQSGLPYFDADTFDLFLNDNLGKTDVNISGGTGFLTYVATDGTLTGDGTISHPLGVVSGTNLPTKSGKKELIDFSGNPKKSTVVFLTPFSDDKYNPILTCETSSNFSYVPNVENITANGFDINMSVNSIINLISVRWIAIKDGETI